MKSIFRKIYFFFTVEDDKELISYRRLFRYTIFLVGIFGITFITTLIMMLRNPNAYELPNFVGLDVVRALGWVESRNMEFKILEKHSETVPRFYIIGQRPGAGILVKEGRKVQFTVSSGSILESMPDFTSNTFSVAKKRLLNIFSGLRVVPRIRRVDRFSIHIPKGRIIDQSPRSGAAINVEKGVLFLVSRGAIKERFIVENYFLRPYDVVALELTGLGVHVNANYLPTDAAKDYGKIFKQSKAPGSIFLPDDEIFFTVGIKKAEAGQAMELARLGVFRIKVPFSSDFVSMEPIYEEDFRDTNFLIEGAEVSLSGIQRGYSAETNMGKREVKLRVLAEDSLGVRVVFEDIVLGGELLAIPYQVTGDAFLRVYFNGVFYEKVEAR